MSNLDDFLLLNSAYMPKSVPYFMLGILAVFLIIVIVGIIFKNRKKNANKNDSG